MTFMKRAVGLVVFIALLAGAIRAEKMVVAAEPLAAEAGLQVLRDGGNAFDAAVAVGFVLAVTYPTAGNISGGGFALVYRPGSEPVALDFREMAPLRATADMFLDPQGEVDNDKALYSALSAGVPGTVRGLAEIHEIYGSWSWARLIQPAYDLAAQGYVLSECLAGRIAGVRDKLARDPDSAALFLPEGNPPPAGHRLVQPNLARTLRRLAEGGPAAFHEGELGADFIAGIQAKGGIMSREDLAGYRAVWRTPVRCEYGPDTLYNMPPPSAGGISLAQILGMFARFRPDDLAHNSVGYIHLLAEIEKRVYADRNTYLGDPEQVPLRWTKLLEPAYLRRRAAEIDGQQATPSGQVKGGYGELDTGGLRLQESAETTSYLVLDDAGNCVSVTYTLNGSFGSGILLPQTGLLLNNEMDDFAAKPGTPNLYGLVQGPANAVAPGKRMLSSITPTIVLRDGRLRMALGSPGGSRIITTVLQMYLNATLFGMDAPAAVAAPRFHHQWLPDEINLEPALFADEALKKALLDRGQHVSQRERMGDGVMIVRQGEGAYSASADPRGCGTARVE